MLPNYYQTSRVVSAINGTTATELERLASQFDAVLQQFFVDTADFSLGRWENELGLVVNNSDDLDFRRSRIRSKLRGSGTVTVRLIQNVAESFANGQVEIVERPAAFRFEVHFVSTIGRPPNLEDLAAAIEDIKPAHLAYSFIFTYRTYGELEAYTYGELEAFTYEQLREGELTA